MYKNLPKSRLSIIVLILSFFIFSGFDSYSQSKEITFSDYNRDSRSIQIALNTNGFTVAYRFGKRIDGFRSRLLDIDVAWVKSPKEKRIAGLESKYVYGKLNQLVVGRVGYGRHKEIYGKYADGGIAINYYYTIGLSLGWLKPVYYEIRKSVNSGNGEIIELEKFSDFMFNVNGAAPFYEGVSESQLAAGAFAKFAFSFDINKRYRSVNALELGAILDVYHRNLPIMATDVNRPFLLTLFIAYRFGQKKEHRITEK
jgi:hypothetical protein